MIDWNKVNITGVQTGRFSCKTPNFVEISRVEEICVCGHTRKQHHITCFEVVYEKGNPQKYYCSCPHYKRDNLRFLEGIILAKRGNIKIG